MICWAGVKPLTSVTCVQGTHSGSHARPSIKTPNSPVCLSAQAAIQIKKNKRWDSLQWEAANVSILILISSAELQSWGISECIMQQSFKGTVSRFFVPGFLITACNWSKWNPQRATITTFHFVYNMTLVLDNSTQLSSMNKRRMLRSARHSELDKREGRNSLPQTSLD